MKFGQAIESMNSGKKMQLPGKPGVFTLERDAKGIPVAILVTVKEKTAQAKLTHEDLLSQNWEMA